MLKKIKTFIVCKRGSMGILFVILSLIAVLVITGFIDILRMQTMFNEVQSVMDVAGASALQAGVDQEELKNENLVVDKSDVRVTYRELIANVIHTDVGTINEYSIYDNDIVIDVTNSNWGLGTSTKNRPQVILDVVMRVQIDKSVYFDTVNSITKTFYDSFSKEGFTVSYNGQTKDGNTELIIRSVTRIVYR